MIIVLILRKIKESKSTHKGCVNRFYRLQWLWRFRVPLNIYLSFLYFMINSIPPTIHKHKKTKTNIFEQVIEWKTIIHRRMGYVCTNTKRIKAQVWAILAMTKQAFALLLFLSVFFFSCWIADETFLFAQAFVYRVICIWNSSLCNKTVYVSDNKKYNMPNRNRRYSTFVYLIYM